MKGKYEKYEKREQFFGVYNLQISYDAEKKQGKKKKKKKKQ